MDIKFLVTTRLEKVTELQQQGYQVIMVDGTVPGFNPRPCDLHFDHHREGGADVQIAEMNKEAIQWVWKHSCAHTGVVFVTTMVDADACAASAYSLLLKPYWDETQYKTPLIEVGILETYRKLKAIAYDCDHLYVPDEMSKYADFAAQCVAAMKESSNSLISELGLNPNRREWSVEDKELFASHSFKQGTEHLVDACLGKRPFPGEQGEAKNYWEKVKANTAMLADQSRVSLYRDAVIIDMKGLGGQYIDPRCPLRVVKSWDSQPKTPVTITQREIYVENEFKGYSYTLGSIPWHPRLNELNYCKGVFDALTDAEVSKGGDSQINKWGGRKTVGGSGWNAVSYLSPEEVIDVVLSVL